MHIYVRVQTHAERAHTYSHMHVPRSPKEPFSWGKQPPDQMRVLAEYIRVSIRGRGGQGWD